MDFRKLRGSLDLANGSTNDTRPNLTELPNNLLEALIPGYSLISRFVLHSFGFDIGVVVSIGVLLFGLVSSVSYIWGKVFRLFSMYYMSDVYIEDGDDLYENVLEWIGAHKVSKGSRCIKAVTKHNSPEPDDDEFDANVEDDTGIFNVGRWAAKVPPRYEPYYDVHIHFWHQGRLFMVQRSRRASAMNPYQPAQKDEETLRLSCVGRRTQPIKDLLDYIKVWSIDKEKARTVIRRPAGKERFRFAGMWDRASSRPSRPMETVALDPEQKKMIIDDINEYLHPSSPRWYAVRGIPYRRGYLFHGPPGVGKTSLAYALAGIFGLDIYVISLLEPTLTESDLNRLFNNLPRRCIVLLEDIDTAGLHRDEKSDDANVAPITTNSNGTSSSVDGPSSSVKKRHNKNHNYNTNTNNIATTTSTNSDNTTTTTTPTPAPTSTPLTAETLAQALTLATAAASNNNNHNTTHNRRGWGKMPFDADQAKQGISLSGLLNAIDGVASHEGRVLVMTTNHPERLDEALIRPGRVDLQVRFTLATRVQMRDIFVRMYDCGDEKGGVGAGVGKMGERMGEKVGQHHHNYSRTELEGLARTFAEALPEGRLSPAEIQGFLLVRKKEPQRAVEEVEEWCEAVLEARGRRSKVVGVQ